MEQIFQFLEAPFLLNSVRGVCKDFQSIADNSTTWMYVYKARWKTNRNLEYYNKLLNSNFSHWKDLFKKRHECEKMYIKDKNETFYNKGTALLAHSLKMKNNVEKNKLIVFAIDYYENSVLMNQQKILALRNWAVALANINMIGEGLEKLRIAITEKPDEYELLSLFCLFGKQYVQSMKNFEDYDKTIREVFEMFEKMINIRPTARIDYGVLIADYLHRLFRYLKSTFRKMDPMQKTKWIQSMESKFQRGLELFENSISVDEQKVRTFLGRLYTLKVEYIEWKSNKQNTTQEELSKLHDKAITNFEICTKLDPKLVQPHIQLVIALYLKV